MILKIIIYSNRYAGCNFSSTKHDYKVACKLTNFMYRDFILIQQNLIYFSLLVIMTLEKNSEVLPLSGLCSIYQVTISLELREKERNNILSK